MQDCQWTDLGHKNYTEVREFQLQLFEQKLKQKEQAEIPQQDIIAVEHSHVYTFGKSAKTDHLLANDALLKHIGAEVHHIERGGDITYHGPGQLVIYPILDLEPLKIGVKTYIEALEQAIILTLEHFGIRSGIISGKTGVWLDIGTSAERKIAAIGVKASRYVTMHGLALNVEPDLRYFEYIVPCGIPDKAVTSMAKELGNQPGLENVKAVMKNCLSQVFGFTFV